MCIKIDMIDTKKLWTSYRSSWPSGVQMNCELVHVIIADH